MSDTYLQVRLDSQIKADAEQVFANLGLSATQAVKLFLRQVVLRQAIPFALTLTPPTGISQEEEAMLASSMSDLKTGKVVAVEMDDPQQVAQAFDV